MTTEEFQKYREEVSAHIARLDNEVSSLKLAVRQLLDRGLRDKEATPFPRPKAVAGLDASDPIGG